ncbi:hypothetical protein BLNAU_20223 [Blattamonas nauphoetae]|uniref:Uncharacterized protein n=1 Tax=Blattamonas nauphoetae TaxID=2049346 RepID=A0ABQ9WZI5_9EUKA|nr:hypothetical protein BLNAU_20223 [Blattamonas nauphoetae]
MGHGRGASEMCWIMIACDTIATSAALSSSNVRSHPGISLSHLMGYNMSLPHDIPSSIQLTPASVSSTFNIQTSLDLPSPTIACSLIPTIACSLIPTIACSLIPTIACSLIPTIACSLIPTIACSLIPTIACSLIPTIACSLLSTFCPIRT